MKYFISDEHWDIDGYWKQILSLENRLSKRAYKFFSKHDFHDALILSINIIDMFQYSRKRKVDPTVVEMKLVDYIDSFEYIIRWSGVVKYDFSFDGREKTYFGTDGKEHHYKADYKGIDEWGYDELTIFDEKYLSHEIELHSGAKLLIHFRNLNYKRSKGKIKRKWLNKVF